MGVAVGGLDFDDAFAHFEDRDIEGTAAEVVDRNGFVFLFVQTVSQRGRSRLVNDALHIQPGDFACVLGGLTLRVVEICRNGDNGFGYLLAEVVFRSFLQFLKNHCGDLRRGVLLALGNDGHVVA